MSLEEKVSSPASNSGTTMGKPDMKESKKWPTMKEILDPQRSYWEIIFIVSCLFAVLVDPLFLYIPIIDEDMKCMKMDRNLKIVALSFRSATDLFYILNIIFQINRSESSDQVVQRSTWYRWSYILVDIIAVLPLPQFTVLIFFSKMRSSLRSLIAKKILNFLVMLQYVPRVLGIYKSCEELKKTRKEDTPPESKALIKTPIWVKGLLNFFVYILASHVLGAFWYFFAFQQITTCWLYACQNDNKCEPSMFDCHNHHTSRNLTFINDLCPINSPNPTLFDFGIYLPILRSGLLGSKNFLQKFSNCFWWGLRHLSSLGQNLEPSIDTWENFFAISISITGLLLFIYLIGNLQTYMQLETTKSIEKQKEECRRKEIEEKKKKTEAEIKEWLSKNGIPSSMKEDIMAKVEQEIKEDRKVDVKNIISILPYDLRTHIKDRMPLARLKRGKMLRYMEEEVLKAISEKLEPRRYTKDTYIIEENRPLELMLFIVDGRVRKRKNCDHRGSYGPLEYYGEELLQHLVNSPNDAELPSSEFSISAEEDVEALVLTAENFANRSL